MYLCNLDEVAQDLGTDLQGLSGQDFPYQPEAHLKRWEKVSKLVQEKTHKYFNKQLKTMSMSYDKRFVVLDCTEVTTMMPMCIKMRRSRLKKNEREKQRSAEVTSQDSNKSSFHLRFKLMTFFTKGRLSWRQTISCGKTISDRQKQKCWKWDGGKVLLCNDWNMRHSALIIIVRQTQNAACTDFTWQRQRKTQRKRMPNKKRK